MVRVVDRRSGSRRSAFTLLEVLVVVAIIVILVSLSSVYVFRALEDANKSAAIAKAHSLAAAAQRYQLKYGAPPETLDRLVQPPDGTPFVGQDMVLDPWNHPFMYDASGPRNGGLKPDVWAVAPDGTQCGNWPNH